uniref:Phospholipase-like protein n=1 Tax=Tanacetum cinerariifolium TaxID=118510 RepID=A0A6L2L7I4_TANCI|nr:phospholipase-like protein [Tanacetum cinerariifolium]
MRLVENIKEWNVFLWGEYIWRHLYDQIVNVVSKHKWEHLKGISRSRNYILTYTLSGILWDFKVWILKSCEQSCLWWNKEQNVIPSALGWSRKEEFKVNVDLTAIIFELKSDWYIAFRDFFMVYIPRNALIKCNNLYEDYFKKLFAAHKQAKIATTDLPMVPRCDSSYLLKEIKLKDNVITQLNTRVFKLEAIIQVFGHEINDVSLVHNHFHELKNDFNELIGSPLYGICPSIQDNDFNDDVIKGYLIEEEIRLRAEQKESWRLQEQKVMEEVFVKRLKEEHDQPEDTSELFQKLLEDLQIINEKLAEYINSPSWNCSTFYNNDEDHSVQFKEYLENSSNAITASNFNQEKEGPPQDFDIHQLIRVECCIEVFFTTFSNPIFDCIDDFTSSDDESLFDEDVPMEDFKVYSNPLFDNEEIRSDEIDLHYLNVESNFIESLSNHDTLFDSSLKFDYLEEFFGELMPTSIIDEERIRREHEEYISLMEKLFTINSFSHPLENFHANTIIETLPPSPIPVEDSDSLREEIDIFTGTDDFLPLGIGSDDYDSEGDIHFLKELLVNDSIPFPENESSNFDHQDDPSFPRPPPKPPDVEFFFDLEPGLISAVMNNTDEIN